MTLEDWGVSPSQWRYCRFWLIAVLLTECIMLVFNRDLAVFYNVICVLFLGGLLLRIFQLYPGQSEPLILDFSAVVIAFGFGILAKWLGESPWRFLLILCSSAIVLPHFYYIAKEK